MYAHTPYTPEPADTVKIENNLRELRWRTPDLEGLEDWWKARLNDEGMVNLSWYAFPGADLAKFGRSIRILLSLTESRLWQLENNRKKK